MNKNNNNNEWNRSKRTSKRAERINGDLLLYFCLHTIFSVLFFFILTVGVFKIYINKIEDVTFGFIFSEDFWGLVFKIFGMYIISTIIGRGTAYYIINAYFKKQKGKAMKRWGELNSRINKIGLVLIISAFLTSVFYAVGIIIILQDKIFNENSLLTLIATYILFKLGVYFAVRWFVGAKT